MGSGIRKQQAAQTEAELQAAAIRVFARTGYLNAKIVDITAEAGRSAGMFYKHFASKEKLLEALLSRLLAQSDEVVADAGTGHPDDFRDRDAVRWHVTAFVRAYREHRTVMIALQQAATVDETFARRQQEMLAPDLEHLAGHLSRLDLRVDPIVAASMMTNLMWSFASTWWSPPGGQPQLTEDTMIDTMTTFIHGGLMALSTPLPR
ncbi:TetR/AcrR family transcriptional regulator [Catenuloplanes japonicus]|uniref:TetR/AcrR family transcriptional regulator n=1 Tax=Catenuloplanes japonicus TaxID=33876 RepID=UPI000524DD0F|nr:TetR/AcrR family transcriptional regulator [Catenuloplanes japonicus]